MSANGVKLFQAGVNGIITILSSFQSVEVEMPRQLMGIHKCFWSRCANMLEAVSIIQ